MPTINSISFEILEKFPEVGFYTKQRVYENAGGYGCVYKHNYSPMFLTVVVVPKNSPAEWQAWVCREASNTPYQAQLRGDYLVASIRLGKSVFECALKLDEEMPTLQIESVWKLARQEAKEGIYTSEIDFPF